MASSIYVDFHADVLALTQGNQCASLLPLLRQLKGWDEVSRLSYTCCMTVLCACLMCVVSYIAAGV